MWKIFLLAGLVASIILVCPVNQSHGFDLEQWIPSFDLKSLKEGLTSEANCIEVFDDSSESTSISCTPKNSQQGVEQTQQQTQKTQQQVQQPIPQQTQQQARKTLPSTLINCNEQEHVWNGKANHALKKGEHNYSIDPGEKKLRAIGKTLPWQKVLEFSDHLIKVERINKKKTRVDTLTINRITGGFKERRVSSKERDLKLFGKPGVLEVSGRCEKIEATPKF